MRDGGRAFPIWISKGTLTHSEKAITTSADHALKDGPHDGRDARHALRARRGAEDEIAVRSPRGSDGVIGLEEFSTKRVSPDLAKGNAGLPRGGMEPIVGGVHALDGGFRVIGRFPPGDADDVDGSHFLNAVLAEGYGVGVEDVEEAVTDGDGTFGFEGREDALDVSSGLDPLVDVLVVEEVNVDPGGVFEKRDCRRHRVAEVFPVGKHLGGVVQ